MQSFMGPFVTKYQCPTILSGIDTLGRGHVGGRGPDGQISPIYFFTSPAKIAKIMAYHQNPPLATAVPIPVPETAGEYTISRKSTDVDESMVRALQNQGYTRGMRYVELLQIILSCSQSYACSAFYFYQALPSRWHKTMQHSH